MTDAPLLDRAASCYLRVGQVAEAARCYREAGYFARSADLFARIGRYRDAATDYAAAGLIHIAAWVLVHNLNDPTAARASLAPDPGDPADLVDPGGQIDPADLAGLADPVESAVGSMFDALERRLVSARCDVADRLPYRRILPVLADVQAMLAEASAAGRSAAEPAWPANAASRRIEEWAVALAEAAHRYDQVALVFAAAVRGVRPGAEQRWAEWSARVLHTELTLPSAARQTPAATSAEPATSPSVR